jgi:hypothetical protein
MSSLSRSRLRSIRVVIFLLLVCVTVLGVMRSLNSATEAKPSSVFSKTKKPEKNNQNPQKPGRPDEVQSLVQRGAEIESEERHDLSPPLFAIPPAARASGHKTRDHEKLPRPTNPNKNDPVAQTQAAVALAPVTTFNFDGVGSGFTGPQGTFTVNSAPPDTNGDVGPNHYVQIVNTDFAVFNKSGTVLYGPVPINTLWSGFGGGCQTNNDGDPVVVYDSISDRWVISQFSVSTKPYLQCVAVSQTPDPTGAYFRYSFSYGNTDFPDYPKMGVWPDGYYITFNVFANGSTFSGTKVCAYDRTKMLAGQAATQQCFNTSNQFGGLLPSDLDGSRQPPAGSPNYIVGLGSAANQLATWKFHVDWAAPANSTFTGPSTLATANFTEACNGGTCITQSGTTRKLDSLADRLMFRLAYRNLGDHEALVVNHSVTSGSSSGVRWYELRPNASQNLSIFQQGTYAPDSNYRWMGSVAMDQSGNIGLGFSVSGSSIHPQIHYTGRLASSPAGQMDQGEASIIDGAGSQNGTLSRWGDYSMLSVDPSDDCTFWYTNEYIPSNGTFNWRTRIASFKFPGCGTTTNDFSIAASPGSQSVVQGNATSYNVTTNASGTPQTVTLSVSGLPAGATGTFNPASVTAGGSSSLSVTTAASTPTGTYTLTITGSYPGGTPTHSTTVQLVVTAPVTNNFSISASPSSLTIAQGGSGSSTISTVVVSGSPETISLAVSGAPAGVTASLNPTSITAGGSSALSVTVSASAAPGTYTLTVSGTAPSATHSTNVSLTVTAPSSQLLLNPGFESGNVNWVITSGVISNSGRPAHSGSWFAWLDGYGTTHTDSCYQQITVPSSATSVTLSFWIRIDTAETTTTTAFDKLQVQIRNSSNTVLATLATYSNLNKNTSYVQKTFDLSAYKGQTIRVYFLGTEDSSLQTSFVIDDTAVNVQ